MRSSSFSAVIVATLLLTSPSSAQVEGIATSMAVNQFVNDTTASLQTIIDDTGDTVNSSAFATREQLQILVWEIQVLGESLADKTFGQLDQTQREFFQNTYNMIEAWNAGNRQSLKRVSGLLSQANDTLGTIPGAHRKPRVTGFSPHFLDSRKRQAVLRVTGSWLGMDEPTLVLGGKPCTRSGKIESELTFVCPTRFGRLREPMELGAKLVVVERLGLLESLLSWLDEPPTRSYEIPLTVMPPVAGHFRASFMIQRKTLETHARTQDFVHRNDHCQGSRSKTWNFSARSGWKIDVDTVRVSHDGNDESSWQGIDNLTEAGFQAKARVRNQGSCGPFYRDGRGKVWGRARWTEFRETATTEEIPGSGGSLVWGRDTEIRLPPGAQSFAITVDLLDGSRRILTSAEPHRWLRLIDETPDRLVLRVSDLATSLR